MSALDLGSLQKAIASLGRAIARVESEPADLELRDGAIQRFEYTYELCWKMLKRRIELDHPNPIEVDTWSFRELIRDAAERDLVEDPGAWFEYRERRNITSHAYDEAKARLVYDAIAPFHRHAMALLAKLEQRNRADDAPRTR